MVAYVFPTLQLSADGQSGASNAQADTFNEPKARRVASHPLAWSSMADLYRMLMGTAQSSNLLVRVCVCQAAPSYRRNASSLVNPTGKFA